MSCGLGDSSDSEFDFSQSDDTSEEGSSLHRADNTRRGECPGSEKGRNGGVGDDSSDTGSVADKSKLGQRNKRSISFSDEVEVFCNQKQQSCGVSFVDQNVATVCIILICSQSCKP